MTAEQITTAMLACTKAAEYASRRIEACADIARAYPHLAKANLDHAAFWQHEEQRYREAHAALMNLPHSNENTETETK